MSMEDVYRKLQQHIDNQAVGYPELESGAEVRILKLLFTPEEAEKSLYLSYKFESIEDIYERAKESGINKEDLDKILSDTALRGGIGLRVREGRNQYKILPLAVGFYETQTEKLTPEFVKEFVEISGDPVFAKAFLSTKVLQMRTIPIEQSITPEHHTATYDELEKIIDDLEGPIVVHECPCRVTKEIEGKKCEKTSRLETCVSFRDSAEACIRGGIGRQVSKEEILKIFRKNQEEGLVLQPSNAKEPEFICSCCGCCCGTFTRLAKVIPNPADYWCTNYQAEIDHDLCSGCQTCVDRCQVKAIRYKKAKNLSFVNKKRCIGCGLCVETCPTEAITLKKRETEIVPPQTDDDLYDILMEHKKAS